MEGLIDQLRRKKQSDLRRNHVEDWTVYNSPVQEYEKTFEVVLRGMSLSELISPKEKPLVIDLMASTEGLASLFSQLPDQPRSGIALSLEDTRTDEQKLRDKRMGIEHLTGDLNISSTWKLLVRELAGRKADLIIERGGGGMHHVPINEKYYAVTLNQLWSITSNDNGNLFLQGPTVYILNQMGIRVEEWVDLLNKNNIQADYSKGKDDQGFDYGILRLTRSPHSPDRLPLLA